MRRTSQNRREWTQNGVYENIPAFVFQRRGYSARFPRLNAERCGGSRVRTEGAKKSYSWKELNRSKKIEYTYSSNPRFAFGDDQTYSHLGAGHHSRAHCGDRPGLSVNSVAVGGDHPARVLAWRSGV